MYLRAAAALVLVGLTLSVVVPDPASPLQADVASIFTTAFGGWSATLQGQPMEPVAADVDHDEDEIRLHDPPPDGADAFLVRPDGVVAFPGNADLVVSRGNQSMIIHLTLDDSVARLARYPMDLGMDEGIDPICPSRVEAPTRDQSPLPFPVTTGHQMMVFDVPVAEGASTFLELGDPLEMDCPQVVVGLENLDGWTVLA